MKPSYHVHDPKGWCGDPKRGAALGRPTIKGPKEFAGRIYLQRVHLNQDGEDCNGTYFGHGTNPLYWYASVGNEIDGTLRAATRAEARSQVLAMYPLARVRR